MFDLKNKKSKICFLGMLISLVIFLIVFFATDGLTGDKEFSEYTHEDWSIAIVPLSVIIVSGISMFVFALIIIIPMKWMYPALNDYVTNKKFSDLDPETEFMVFPIFIVADCFICCGCIALMVHLAFFNKAFWKEEKQ